MKEKNKAGDSKLKFSKVLPNLIQYYKDNNKKMEKFLNVNKPLSDKPEDNPDIMPAYSHDYGNYVARFGMGTFQIHVIMKLDGRLDYEKLKRSVRLSVDAEPILGCRFIEHDPPYWKRLENLDNTEFCSLLEVENSEEGIESFLEAQLDMDKDPMVKVMLIRTPQFDTIGLKLNHTCSDGAGTKDYLLLLSEIYSSIDSGKDYVPKPRLRSREDHKKVLKTLGIKNPMLDFSIVESPKTVWPFPWKRGVHKNTAKYVKCQLTDGYLDILSKFGKERGATINDLIIAAFYRAMFKLTKVPYGIPMDMGLTVDLRRYLPDNKAEAIRNFSGGIVLSLERISHEPFIGTMKRVSTFMNSKKSQNPGFQCASGAERAEIMLSFSQFLAFSKFISRLSEFTSQNCFFCSPGLSNVGLISKSFIKFGEQKVTEAYFVPPVVRPPAFLLVASGYNGILTLSAGYYEGSINRQHMEELLEKIKSELIEGCK